MNKNSIIALLVGLLIGQGCGLLQVKAAQDQTITRHDLMEAAALTGILANEHHDPLGYCGFFRIFRGPKDFRDSAREYADSLK